MRVERFEGALLLALPTVLLITLALLLSSAGLASAAPDGLTPHDPIYIEGNYNFIPANGVVSGSGTENDPYIIENWSISAENANGIEIRNTTVNFIIRNCQVEKGCNKYWVGISLDNVVSGKVENCTLENNHDGIQLRRSSNNILTNNVFENNAWRGIWLSYSDNNTLSNNTCENNNWSGISLSHSDNNTLTNNASTNNNGCGIHLYSYSDNNILVNNVCENNGNTGIELWFSDNNTLINNTCRNNQSGIYLWASNNITMENNALSNNRYNFGVWDKFAHQIDNSNTVNGKPILYLRNKSSLVINQDNEPGYLGFVSCENVVVGNVLLENNGQGVLLANTKNSRVENVRATNNYLYGICLRYSDNNTLRNNTCRNNEISGIHLSYSSSNTLANNNCRRNRYGISLWGSDNSLIFNNLMVNNDNCISFVNSDNNLVHHNNFINNTHQAYDNGTNYWDNGYPSGGNFWSDYTGEDNYLGENQDLPGSDGIGDSPYNIPGDNNQDCYPLMSPVSLRTEVRTIYPSADVYAYGEYLEGCSRSQLRFDISGIPPGANITSAKLWLYRFAADNWDGNITLYRVENQVWDETITASEFDAQILADEENHVSKFMSQGWDYLDVLNQLESDYNDNNTYTSFRLKWINDNESEPSVGVDDGRFLFINSEANELSISFCASEYDGRDPYLEVVYVPPHAVSVSILPTYQSGKPGKELSYSVTVANMGNLDDNYVLTVSDNAGWGPVLLDNLLEVPAGGENQTTLSVTVPANSLGCSNDNVIVTATSRADNTVSDSDSCIAHAEIVRDVQVSISPSYQENLPGETLIYDITVRNTGNIAGIYTLENSDSLGWSLSLENTSLAIPPFEYRTTKLTVTIPENAIPCTNDNIRVIATSQENENVSAEDSCIAHASIVLDVEVSILPGENLVVPGENVIFTVTITNTGNVLDNYDLTVSENLDWSPTLDDNVLEDLPPGENGETTLRVTVPENTENCTRDKITVNAISQADNAIRDNASCIAHAVVTSPRLPTQPQLSSPSNGSEVSTKTPTLRWENAMHAENHRVLLDDDSDPDDNPLYDHIVKGDDKWTTPTLTEDETYYWKVIAQNENGENHSVIWHFTVNAEGPAPPPPTNRSPTADAGGSYSVQENGTVELDGTGSTDPDGDPLTYSWTIVDDPTGGASLTDDDTATPVFHAPEHIDNTVDVTVRLSVNDGHGHTDSDTATVTIQPAGVNLPPTADADGPYSVQEDENIELDGTGSSDSDGTIVAYSWTIIDDPTGEASLTDSDTATPVFYAPSVESDTEVTVELTVEDDDGATDTDTATVTVRAAGVGPPQYELSTLASPPEGGTVTLDPPGGIYEEGTEVTVTAEPADNYEFDHWSGDVSGTSTSVTITMDSDKIVTAHFRSISEEGRGLPLIPLGLGVLMLIIILTIIAMIAARRRRPTRSPAKSSKPLLRKP